MERNGFLAVLLFISIVAGVSKASSPSLVSKHRILIGGLPKANSTVTVTPATPPAKTPTPDQAPKALTNGNNPGPRSLPTDPNPVPDKTREEDPNKKKNLKDKPVSASPPSGDNGKSEDIGKKKKKKNDGNSPNVDMEKSEDKEKKKNDDVTIAPTADKESCEGVIKTCEVKDAAVACIKSFESGSKEVAILVQNVGDSTLKARLSAENNKDLEIPKHQSKKVTISLDIDKSTKITLNTGNGVCELHMDPPVSERNFFLNLPSYEKLVTPINGAYFLIVTVLIFGGIWACCKVRKRKQRTGGGVPYQELEMGLPDSATAVETAEGWDQGWDDDWDGDNAVKSPRAHLGGSISANGLTSRSSNKDGWENDWDD